MIKRQLFTEKHHIFRTRVREFIATEILPYHAQWERDGVVPRSLWLKAGAQGFLCCTVPTTYGGAGLDYLHDVIVLEELFAQGLSGPGFMMHTDVVATYINSFASEEQKQRYLPRMVRGEIIGALGMTEPHAGSDLKNIRTYAERQGEYYVVNGQKVFISNGQLTDLLILAVKTDKNAGASGISLIIVDGDTPGLVKGANLKKLGLKAQDTSELFFSDMKVPASNLLGEEGRGFAMMMEKLAKERISQAIRSAAVAESIIAQAVAHVSKSYEGEEPLSGQQYVQFMLAEMQAESVVSRVFVDHCIALYMEGALDPLDAAIAKLKLTELHCKVVDGCLQLFGEEGYLWRSPVCRAYADARIAKIAGGSMEVMKTLIARDLFRK